MMAPLHVIAAALVVATLPSAFQAASVHPVTFNKAELGQRFLLQVSYELQGGRQDFRTSRSRIVTFEREGVMLNMLDVSDVGNSRPRARRVLAAIPIHRELATALD